MGMQCAAAECTKPPKLLSILQRTVADW